MREKFFTSVSYIVFCIFIPITVWITFLFNYIGYIMLAVEILLYGFVLHLWDFKLVREIMQLCSSNMTESLEELRRIDIFNFKKIKTSKNIIQKPLIIDIIKKYHITTNDGLEEVIDHYRFKASESRQIPIDFLALFSLAVSIISFFISSDIFYKSISKILMVLFLIFIFLVYIVFLYIYRAIFAKFSKKAFYTRIESELSENRAMNKLSSDEKKIEEKSDICEN